MPELVLHAWVSKAIERHETPPPPPPLNLSSCIHSPNHHEAVVTVAIVAILLILFPFKKQLHIIGQTTSQLGIVAFLLLSNFSDASFLTSRDCHYLIVLCCIYLSFFLSIFLYSIGGSIYLSFFLSFIRSFVHSFFLSFSLAYSFSSPFFLAYTSPFLSFSSFRWMKKKPNELFVNSRLHGTNFGRGFHTYWLDWTEAHIRSAQLVCIS